MKLETELNIALTEFFRPIVAQCVQEAIQKINLNTSLPPDDEPFGDFSWVKKVAKGIPENTLRQWDAAGKIPGSMKFGKRKLYEKASFLSWLRSQTRQTIDLDKVERTADLQVNAQLSKRSRKTSVTA